MRRIVLLIAVLACGIGVGYLLSASKLPTTVVALQSAPTKAKTVTPVIKKNNQPAEGIYVIGGIKEVGFADTYVPQPVNLNGGQVTADNTNQDTHSNSIQ